MLVEKFYCIVHSNSESNFEVSPISTYYPQNDQEFL